MRRTRAAIASIIVAASLLAIPAAAGAFPNALTDGQAKRACRVAERQWNRSGLIVENSAIRRVLRAFDQDGVPRRLHRIAERLVDSPDPFEELTTLVGACRRLGHLPD